MPTLTNNASIMWEQRSVFLEMESQVEKPRGICGGGGGGGRQDFFSATQYENKNQSTITYKIISFGRKYFLYFKNMKTKTKKSEKQ